MPPPEWPVRIEKDGVITAESIRVQIAGETAAGIAPAHRDCGLR